MNITITWQMVMSAFGVVGIVAGFLLGGFKWLLSRELTSFEGRVGGAEKKAGEAIGGLAAHKETMNNSLTAHKEVSLNAMAALELKLSQRSACTNHQRMENQDKDLFVRIDSLHGDIRELIGTVKGLTNSVELLNRHHLEGGK